MSVKLVGKKKADEKISLYLDTYHNGRRQYDFFKLYLLKGTYRKIKGGQQENTLTYLTDQRKATNRVAGSRS